ncbi:hypothetical protein K439DRAFT_1397501, partial [Ramaria rubella]
IKVTSKLSQKQTWLLLQLCTGHVPLNKHLHRIGKTISPHCQHCPNKETVHHFLLLCPAHAQHRQILEN